MVYKFVIISDEVEDFKRVIKIDSDATFKELNEAILDSVGYTHDQMTSFFICESDWEKLTEITLVDMGKDSDEDIWLMDTTRISDLVEDEGQRLMFVFDYLTDRAFFMELRETIFGEDLDTPVCTKKVGDAPAQMVDFEEIEKNTYNMVGGKKIFKNIMCMIIPADKITHTNGIKTNKQLVLPVCSNQNIIVLK